MKHEGETMAAVEPDPALGGSGIGVPVDAAYEEFCRRRQRGEAVDPDAFCAEHPELQSRLEELLRVHLFLEQNPRLLDDAGEISWPVVGERFLDFDLIGELGRGAFARVYLASIPKLGGRLAALKLAWHSGAEAKILGRLQHPNIMPIHSADADPHTRLTAVCMPYLGGATLRDVMDRLRHEGAMPVRARFLLDVAGALPHPLDASARPQAAARILQHGFYGDGVRLIGAQLADALALLHASGIHHHDLKPSNVLLTPQGVPMLLDFNLSGDARRAALAGGTIPYMAPEKLSANDGSAALDFARSDVFALGVILFELATGAHPFGPIPASADAEELSRLLLARMDGAVPDACRHNPGIDRSLGKLIARCLAFDAAERPEAGEVTRQLRRQLQPIARLGRGVRRHPRWSAAAFVFCALLAVVAPAVVASRPPLAKRQMDAGIELHQQGKFQDAIAQFTAILNAHPQDADARLARARAFQQLAAADRTHYPSALADYQEADRLRPDARSKAGIAFCLSQTGNDPRFAIACYQAARDLGGENAALCNNIGCLQLKTGALADAEASLNRAIALDARCQPAYHNRALVHLQKALALKQPAVNAAADAIKKQKADFAQTVQRARQDIARAIELGPVSAELCFDAGRIHVLADDQKAALDYLRQAVEAKCDPRRLAADASFADLAGDADFAKLVKTPPPEQPPPRAIRLIQPDR